jgi:hypothetical protein
MLNGQVNFINLCRKGHLVGASFVAGELIHGYITFPHIWRRMKILNTPHIYSANTALGLTNS